MRAVVKVSTAAGLCLAMAGCGELHRDNELFSSAAVQPATFAEPPPTQVAARPAPTTSRRGEPEPQAAPVRRSRPAAASAVAARAPEAELAPEAPVQLASVDASEASNLPRPAARPDGTAEPASAVRDGALPDEAERAPRTALLNPPAPARPSSPTVRPDGPASEGEAAGSEGPDLATSDEIMGGILRTWNKIAAPELSSKVLFGVWPEQLDGVPPDLVELQKRSETAIR